MPSVFAPPPAFLKKHRLALVRDRFSHPSTGIAGSCVVGLASGIIYHYALRELRPLPQDAIPIKPDIVKKIRLSVGDSQKAFADRMHVSVATVCRWERGKNRIGLEYLTHLRRLQFRPSKALDPSVDGR